MKRLKRIGVLQTSIVGALVMAGVSVIVFVPFAIIAGIVNSVVGNTFPFSGGMFLVGMPILYGIIGFVMTALSCFVYNLIAQWVGGIEFELEDVELSKD